MTAASAFNALWQRLKNDHSRLSNKSMKDTKALEVLHSFAGLVAPGVGSYEKIPPVGLLYLLVADALDGQVREPTEQEAVRLLRQRAGDPSVYRPYKS